MTPPPPPLPSAAVGDFPSPAADNPFLPHGIFRQEPAFVNVFLPHQLVTRHHVDQAAAPHMFVNVEVVCALPAAAPFAADDHDDEAAAAAASDDEDDEVDDGLSEEAIANFLPVCEKSTSSEVDGGDSKFCAVCQDDLYQQERRVGILGCDHVFHADCIGKWLRIKNICPLCRDIALS